MTAAAAATTEAPIDPDGDEVLLPSTKRWRLRIVSRYWRDVIHERTPPAPDHWRRRQPSPLVFFQNYNGDWKSSVSAFVIDDDLAGGRRGARELWRTVPVPPDRLRVPYPRRPWVSIDAFDTAMVGTCNGLLCLCDNTVPGGAISLLDPVTGEPPLTLPPLPGSKQWVWWGMQLPVFWSSSGWHHAYSFAYDPMTEQYKVVHLPCYLDRSGGFNTLQVFALGKKNKVATSTPAAWRDVATPGASCCLDAGVVSVDGVTHWVTKAAERVVSFDVREERVASTRAMPVRPKRGYVWQLAEVHGRLGLVSSSERWVTPEKIDVWVLAGGGGGDRHGWSRRHTVKVNDGVMHWMLLPHLAHGDCLLSECNHRVFEHMLRNTAGRWMTGEVRSLGINEETRGMQVSGVFGGRICGVFAYIETRESLSAYNSQAS